MALVVKDRVKETTTTTGTGTLTLAGAVSGFQTFTSVLSNGDTTYYTIFESSTNAFEVGLGTFTSSGTTLARTTILESSNSGSAVDLAAGSKDVFITYPAEKSAYLDASGNLVIGGTAVTATVSELNIMDGVTATTAELNYVDGVTSAIQTQIDTKAAIAGPTFTGTLTAPTINASTALQIGGVAVSSTAAELNILDGVTSTAAELNILDGVTATTAELNYNDVTTLGTSQASKTVTADANGDVNLSEELKVKSYNETYVSLSAGSTVDINNETGNVFALSTNQNTTFTFSNPPSSGTSYGFTLKLTAGGTHSITYPNTVDFAGGTAPDAPASGETDVLVFFTVDGGTNWYGALAIDAAG